MKKLLIILITFGLIFTGCPEPDPDAEYSVVYHGTGADEGGFPPTDDKKYKSGEKAVVLDKHTLYKTGYTFKDWNTNWEGTGDSYNVGDTITITRTVWLHAMWEEDEQAD
jgi:hypothetical protein